MTKSDINSYFSDSVKRVRIDTFNKFIEIL